MEKVEEKKHYIHSHNPHGKGKAVVFIGGPVTLDTEGAVAKENDYVHQTVKRCLKHVRDLSYSVISSRFFEEEYKAPQRVFKYYEETLKIKADVIILQLCDYIKKEDFDPVVFENSLVKFLEHIRYSEDTKFVFLTPYASDFASKYIQEFADRNRYPCLYIKEDSSDFPDGKNTYRIAVALFCVIEKYIRK